MLSPLPQALSDHDWAAAFLQQNQRQLEQSYDLLTGGQSFAFVG